MTVPNDADPVSLEVTGTSLRATDIGGNSITFDLTGWDRLSDPHGFDEPIDAVAVGRVSAISYDFRNMVNIDRLDEQLADTDSAETSDHADCVLAAFEDKRLTLPEGEYFLQFDTTLFVRLRFDGAATVSNRPGECLKISFPQPTPVTFGFKSPVDYPRHEVTVEPTTEGIATGISHLSATIETTTADRVHRNYRGHPPLLTLGEETHVPDPVAEQTPETGIELLVPDRLEALFLAAPLAYYLGARLRPTDVTAPLLRAPSVGIHYEFDGLTQFERDAPALLRRVFFLDQMASWHDPDSLNTREFDRLEDAGVDLDHCADGTAAERLAAYLEFPAAPIDDILPEWPYVMTVEPTVSNVASIPHLLYDLAAIVLPSEHTFAPESDTRRTPDPESTPVTELSQCRTTRGVLGDIEDARGFSALQRGYENRMTHLEQNRAGRTVIVVFGAECDVDRRAIAEQYVPTSTTVRRLDAPTRDELAAAFRSGGDFLHYVGRCEDGELVCQDGTLEPANLRENDVQLFQLDAPDSRAAGVGLIESGSIAGVVRRESESAAPASPTAVSTTIGKLVLSGQSLAAAHTCAVCGENEKGLVVGDGTHRFVAKWNPSAVYVLQAVEDGSVRVTVVPFPVDPVGTHWLPDWSDGKHLTSTPITLEVSPDELNEFLTVIDRPVFYDGRFYWMDERKQLVYPVS
ncbi:hypothetical protein CV102_21180 [Natronococcus pandeyae]|uniref:Uncharacterized protein n=1 Tax=Natronococcus pandeyae TaxID=2055836 RepID=A0A8J8PZC9_9EURY|nr:hypothetical protein [Natronococcus pandeyae]TYL36571.1 hypothetical protein CV102_21180 [Natronococcus pandeyae]